MNGLVLFVSFSIAFSTQAFGVVDADGRSSYSPILTGRQSVNAPLPMPAFTLEEIQHLKLHGQLLVSEKDFHHPHVNSRGVRFEMLTAKDIINAKIASGLSYGLRLGIQYPSQACAERICAVIVVLGKAKK